MARPTGGPSVDQHNGRWRVRFSHDGCRVERYLEARNRSEALAKARKIFAAVLSGIAEPDKPSPRTALVKEISAWISELYDVRPEMRDYCEMIATRWLAEFGSLEAMTSQAIASHIRRRLGEVRGKTVRNELSALRKFLAWALDTGRIQALPTVPTVRASVAGTKHPQPRRVRAPELPPDDVERFLSALPERSRAGWVVRDRLVVAYETTLRPKTLDRLSVPENYRHGATSLTLTDDDDKELYGREVPLSRRAREALERVAPQAGLIFGAHRLEPYVRRAAKATGLPATTCAQHMRSAGITRLLEVSGNLPGVAALAGHRHVSTTARYARPSLRAAQSVIAAADGVLGQDVAGLPQNHSKTSAK